MSLGDAGATRITDVDRNLLVASTDLVGLDWNTVQQRSRSTQRDNEQDRAEIVE